MSGLYNHSSIVLKSVFKFKKFELIWNMWVQWVGSAGADLRHAFILQEQIFHQFLFTIVWRQNKKLKIVLYNA